MGFLPPVVATLLADTKEFMAKMDKAEGKMGQFGLASEKAGSKTSAFASKASTAVLGLGFAIGGYALDKAMKFNESLDMIKNQAGLTKAQTDALGNSILNISATTGQTTANLATAALGIEQAGIRGAKATQLLDLAAKAAVVTNSSVADTTKAIVSAQALQIAKGLPLADLVGKLTAGSKDFVGGLKAEEGMLSGRVAVALSKYGLNLSTIIGLGSQFAKVGLPTRSIVSFTGAFANLEKPMVGVNGKLTTYSKSLEQAGLSQARLVGDLRRGDIAGMLTYIKDQAGGSAAKLQEFVQAVFGTQGGATASVLLKNLKDFVSVQKTVAGAGKGSLAAGFNEAVKQLGPQFKIVMAQVDKLMVEAGMKLLPKVATTLAWANGLIDYFKQHPVVSSILDKAAIGIFSLALYSKLRDVFLKALTVLSGGLLEDFSSVGAIITASLERISAVGVAIGAIVSALNIIKVVKGANPVALFGGPDSLMSKMAQWFSNTNAGPPPSQAYFNRNQPAAKKTITVNVVARHLTRGA